LLPQLWRLTELSDKRNTNAGDGDRARLFGDWNIRLFAQNDDQRYGWDRNERAGVLRHALWKQ
jgi:hypothetical protein